MGASTSPVAGAKAHCFTPRATGWSAPSASASHSVSLTMREPRGAKSHWVAATESTSVRAEVAATGGLAAPRVDVLQ